MMSDDFSPEEQIQFFYEPCKSRGELKDHIKAFLKIDLPDNIIDEDSTSTPLDFIWEVYNVMRTGEGPTRHVVAAARNTAKTLCASIIRFYGMTHFRRDGTHLAANLDQSRSANKYLAKFLQIPEVTPFVRVDNSREKELAGLPPNSYTKRDVAVLRIAVATVGGVNSQRGSLNTRDELDLVPPAILSEAAFISDPTQDEHMFEAIEINLSSRKTNSGPIQTLLDEAEAGKSVRLKAHKWSTVDWMKRCEDGVYMTKKPTLRAWINIETLKSTFGEKDYEVLSSAEKTLQKEYIVGQGCKTCPAFAVCLGRSIRQPGKQRMLRSIAFVDDLITTVKSPDKIIAQALNWKPESSAVIFRTFNKRRHFLGYAASWEWLFGEVFNPHKLGADEIEEIKKNGQPHERAKLTPTKQQIYRKLCETGWLFHYGVDWGYNPDPAVCVVTAYHKKQRRAFILHTESALNHSNQDWADHIREHIYSIFPCDMVCPDHADKASPTYFRKTPSIPCSDKKPPRIETGVSQVRGLLWNVKHQKELLVVLDDGPLGQNEYVADCFMKWTHKKTPLGFDFTKFDTDSEYTHPLDALRYALHPFLDQQDAKIKVSQPKNRGQTLLAASRGDEESIKEVQRMAETETTKDAFQEHLQKEFGLTDIYRDEAKLKAERGPKDPDSTEAVPLPRRGGGLKFTFK